MKNIACYSQTTSEQTKFLPYLIFKFMLRHMQGVFDECTYDAISEMHSIARDVPRQNYWKMDTVVEQY